MQDPLMTLQEAADYLGIKRESARKLLYRRGMKHGYLRSEVQAIERAKGRRTDLEKD
jgi:predicted HTH domain antitoxin